MKSILKKITTVAMSLVILGANLSFANGEGNAESNIAHAAGRYNCPCHGQYLSCYTDTYTAYVTNEGPNLICGYVKYTSKIYTCRVCGQHYKTVRTRTYL